jgi:hypothetical protein
VGYGTIVGHGLTPETPWVTLHCDPRVTITYGVM